VRLSCLWSGSVGTQIKLPVSYCERAPINEKEHHFAVEWVCIITIDIQCNRQLQLSITHQ